MPDHTILQPAPCNSVNPTTSHLEESFITPVHVAYNFRDMIAACQDEPDGIDLADRFRSALQKLEGMLYAALGSVPASYEQGLQWWMSQNPRCNFPEQSFCDFDTPLAYGDRTCDYTQTAAVGTIHGLLKGQTQSIGSTGYFDWSRSGSRARQWTKTLHTRYSNIDSVSLVFSTSNDGYQSGPQYGDPPSGVPITVRFTPPATTAAATQSVKLWWKPGTASVESFAMIRVGDAWELLMPGQPNQTQVLFYFEITATEDGQPVTRYDPHGLAGEDVPPELSDIPQGTPGEQPGQNLNHQQPGSSYYLYVLNHRNDYANGLPELIWELYGDTEKGKRLKRCTGTWAFESWTNITPGLINLARFCIDYLGDRFQHDPDLRGPSPRCCFNQSIRFRWTGANMPWLYREGGKSVIPLERFNITDGQGNRLTDEQGNRLIGFAGEQPIPGQDHTIHPLTNLDAEPSGGSADARKTWRGMPGVYHYGDSPGWQGNMANPYVDGRGNYIASNDFGNDESWLSWPRSDTYTPRNILTPSNPRPDRDEWYPGLYGDHGRRRGLQSGDQTDQIHLLEIIEAVDYLDKYGIWTVVPVKVCKRTPTRCSPWDVQHIEYVWNGTESVPQPHDRTVTYPSHWYWEDQINHPPVESFSYGDDFIGQPCFGGCYYQRAQCHNEPTSGDIVVDQPAIAWDRPADVAECRSGTSSARHIASGYCTLAVQWSAACNMDEDFNCRDKFLYRFCFSPGEMWSPPPISAYGANDPVRNLISKGCQQTQDAPYNSTGSGSTHGWSYYICGVDQAYLGPTWGWWNDNRATPKWSIFDDKHGNGIAKIRANDDCEQPLASMGNRFIEAKRCIVTSDFRFVTTPVAFDSVTDVEFSGHASAWAAPQDVHSCQMSTDIEDEIPPIHGLGYQSIPGIDEAVTPLCRYSAYEGFEQHWPPNMYNQYWGCELTFPYLNNGGHRERGIRNTFFFTESLQARVVF